MWFKVSQIILRNRIVIISIVALLTIVFGYFAFTHLETDNKYGNTLPKNSPAQDEFLRFKDMYGESEGILILAIQTENLYTESNFLHWKQLGDSIAKLPGIQSVFSEADLVTIKNNQAEKRFTVERIFQDESFQDKSIEEIRNEIRNNPFYDGLLYNDSSKVSLMLVSIDEEYLSDMKKSGVVLDAENIAQEYEKYFGKIHFAGLPHIRVVMGKRVVNEMYIFIGLAILVTSLLLYFFFRSIRVVIFCNIVVFTAVIWSLGSIAMMGFKISILMALIPPLMIVIGIPDCVYLLMKFHREIKDHGNKIKALSRVIHRVGNATFLTNLTTALGFSTFIFVNSEKLKEFGLASSLNIMGVFLLSITLIPILYSFSNQPKKRHLKHLDKRFAQAITTKLIYETTTNRKRIYGITIVVMIFSVIGMTRMKATGNLTSDLPEKDPILQDIKFLEKNFNGVIPFEVIIDYKKDARKFDRATLQKVEAVQDELEKTPILSKPMSIINFLKMVNMAYYGNNPDMYKLIERKDMLRLKSYVDSFYEDMERIKQIRSFQDSLRKGLFNYADSILLNSQHVFQLVSEDILPSEEDTDSLVNFDYHHQVKEFLANQNQRKITTDILEATHRVFPDFSSNISMNSLIDTVHTTYRIRSQAQDVGSYEMGEEIKKVSKMLDSILNPKHEEAMIFYENFEKGNKGYIDSIFDLSNAYRNNVTSLIAKDNDSLLLELDMNPELITQFYDNPDFKEALKTAIEDEKLDYFITGVSVVAAEGTRYLVSNLISSIIFAIITISILMALLFASWRMVIISMVPNFIPLFVTAGVMGYFGIPIKPSTLLVFSIAFGIAVDDTIHFLSRYRLRIKDKSYDQKGCIIDALYETGMSMFYTSIILLCGFSMFAFSQFGGTQALGLLISLTLLVAMLTNLFVVPSLLFSLEKQIATKAFFKEPLINIYDEEIDIELDELEIATSTEKEDVEEE